jgi:glucans biosynthesis protein C
MTIAQRVCGFILPACLRSRSHEWDFVRAVFLLLGVLLHAATLTEDSSAVSHGIFTVIHSFRLHGLFLVSGFFCALTLDRYSPEVFLKKRLVRLGIPLVTVSLLDLLFNSANHQHWADFSIEVTKSFWASGEWLQHLWFLSTLIVYVCILFLTVRACRKFASREIPPLALLAALALINFCWVKFDKVWPFSSLGETLYFIQVSPTVHYFVYFTLGYFCFHQRGVLDYCVRKPRTLTLVSLAYFIAVASPSSSLALHYLLEAVEPTHVVAIVSLTLLCSRAFHSRHRWINAIVASAYTVYLLHWPVQVIVRRLLLSDAQHAALHLIVLSVVGFAIPIAIHFLVVERSELARFLLNGETRTKPSTPTSTEQGSGLQPQPHAG